MIRSVLAVVLLVLLAVAFSWGVARAESVRGKVRGVPAVNLREGPSTQSRAVAWLTEGEQVEIESVVDGWALVHTERSETGYVRVSYLAAPEAALSRLQAVESEAPATQHVPEPTPKPEPVSQASDLMEAEMAAPHAQPEEPRQEATAAPDRPEEPPLQEIRRDLRTLLDQTRSIERKLASNSFHGDLAAPMRESPAFPWALLGFGVFIGLLLGGAMGRRQERKRRTRIRI